MPPYCDVITAMSSKPWGALPIHRIYTIMKSSSEAENIGKESTLLMAKASELFIKMLAQEGFKISNGKKVNYKDLAEIVNRDERYEFLRDIMPKKISYAEYKRLQGGQHNEVIEVSSTDDESDSNTSSDSQ